MFILSKALRLGRL